MLSVSQFDVLHIAHVLFIIIVVEMSPQPYVHRSAFVVI